MSGSNVLQQCNTAFDQDWWRGATIYQIYPRSFQDSDGDGIGDLAGIAHRMPYVASLGVDAIWISPFFRSPMLDFGYDVSDYCDVDPMFGSLSDFDLVVEQAHRHGLRVLIDLVLSHTSDQHLWFRQSRRDRTNPKHDWYVWAEPRPDGSAPNNWLSIFGGPAWKWDVRREQYYLHNFLSQQPDLNYHNPEVQDAMLATARFWLDRGVDGFRLDALNFCFHDPALRDNPVLAPELRTDICAPKVNPYNYQDHVFDRNRPEMPGFLRKFRQVLDVYGAAAIGEIGDGKIGLELIGQYSAGDEMVQMCYAFDMLSSEVPTADTILRIVERVEQVVPDGWVCWAFSNHDCQRHASRWNLSAAAQRMMIELLVCLRGSVCLYQGEELGLTESDVPFGSLQDPYGKEFWPEFKGRDGCRTPFVWDAREVNAGFSDARRTWLPVDPENVRRAVAGQERDPGALLQHYRHAISLRGRHLALMKGTYDLIGTSGNVFHFIRKYGSETIFCAFNVGDTVSVLDMPDGNWTRIHDRLNGAEVTVAGRLTLGPWQSLLAVLAG